MMKLLMLGLWSVRERGDTLIEVTFALAILGAVLAGATATTAAAFRLGQTARERTQMAEVAQQQMEALRSFRDNNVWANFQCGSNQDCATLPPPSGYDGVGQAMSASSGCFVPSVPGGPAVVSQCFHMALVTVGGTTQWVAQPGPATLAVGAVPPTAKLEIVARQWGIGTTYCGYDFDLYYQFDTLGGTFVAADDVKTRLANLSYTGGVVCP